MSEVEAVMPSVAPAFDRQAELDRCAARLPPAAVEQIRQARRGPHPESALIEVLHTVQDAQGWLCPEALDAVAPLLQVPTATVTGVATFYHLFRLQPQGRYRLAICLGTACYVKGGDKVSARLQEELGIGIGQTTTDGLFSLEEAHCVGTCALAPVVMVNDRVVGPITPDKIPGLLEDLVQQDRQGGRR